MSSKPTAFITDDLEFDERGPIATGFFGGSLQTEDGGILDAIDEQMSVAEAIRWARERTDNVIVRITGEEPCVDARVGQVGGRARRLVRRPRRRLRRRHGRLELRDGARLRGGGGGHGECHGSRKRRGESREAAGGRHRGPL